MSLTLRTASGLSDESHRLKLPLDSEGKIALGKLEGITQVECSRPRFSWDLIQEGQQSWSKFEDLHIVESESIELPINIAKGTTPE